MKLIVVCGTDAAIHDAERLALKAGSDDVERVDVTADGGLALLAAVMSPSLFGTPRRIEAVGFEEIDKDRLKALKEAAAHSDAIVLARAAKLTKTQRRALPPHQFVDASVATARELPAVLRRRAQAQGINLSAELAGVLAERCRDEPERANQVIAQLALLHLHTPTRRHIDVLVGSTSPKPKPWDVCDLAASGDVHGALALLERLDESDRFGLVGYMRRALLQLDCARRHDPATVAARTGVTDGRASQLVSRARSLDPRRLAAALKSVVSADDALRSSRDSASAVDLAMVRYAEVFTPSRRAPR